MNYIPVTGMELQRWERVKKSFESYQKEIITVRTSDYRGKGRPKKSDYIRIPRGQLLDFRAFEIFNNGFKSNSLYQK